MLLARVGHLKKLLTLITYPKKIVLYVLICTEGEGDLN